jgi:hypothetical protein
MTIEMKAKLANSHEVDLGWGDVESTSHIVNELFPFENVSAY